MKCYTCCSTKDHSFSDCLLSTCTCSCVREIYSMPPNQIEDDVAAGTPGFLKIDNAKIKSLPDLTTAVTAFSKIDHSEWLPRKKDKRRKKQLS